MEQFSNHFYFLSILMIYHHCIILNQECFPDNTSLSFQAETILEMEQQINDDLEILITG